MGKLDYKKISEDTIIKIKQIRNDYSISDMEAEANQRIEKAGRLFDLGGEVYSNYSFVINEGKNNTYELLKRIILALFSMDSVFVTDRIKVLLPNGEYQNVAVIDMFRDYANVPAIAIVKKSRSEQKLILFREYGLNHMIPNVAIMKVMTQLQLDSYEEVLLAKESNYSEDLGPKANENRVTKSFAEFFIENFGIDEYVSFKEFEEVYTKEIIEYMGYEVVKKLNPGALFSFKKQMEKTIKKDFDYYKACTKLNSTDWEYIHKQYIEKNYYKALSSKKDFAVSFLTAEWMYKSIKNGGKMDFAPIAMGYFKAIEEFLFDLVTIYADGTRTIFCSGNPKKQIPRGDVCLDSKCITEYHDYIMLEALIGFIKNNRDIFIPNTGNHLIKVFIDFLYAQKQIRNGYFHKENLEQWSVVEEARNKAFIIFAMALGIINFPMNKLEKLGIPTSNDQFELLCDYINYNASSVYYVSEDGKNLYTSVGRLDNKLTYDEWGVASFSGVHFNKFVGFSTEKASMSIQMAISIDKQKIAYGRENVPAKIYKGTMMQSDMEVGMTFSGPEKLIWSDGEFLGDVIEK